MHYFVVGYAIFAVHNPKLNILFSLFDRTPHVNHSLVNLIFPFPIFIFFISRDLKLYVQIL